MTEHQAESAYPDSVLDAMTPHPAGTPVEERHHQFAYLSQHPNRYTQFGEATTGREIAAYALGFLDGLIDGRGDSAMVMTVTCSREHLPAVVAAALQHGLVARPPDPDTALMDSDVAVRISRF